MRDRIVARIRKNGLSSLVVRLTTYQRRRCIDIRLYSDPLHERGFGATDVGVVIRPDLLRPVIEALERAEAAAKAEGLIAVVAPTERNLPRKPALSEDTAKTWAAMANTPKPDDDKTLATGKSQPGAARLVKFETNKGASPTKGKPNPSDEPPDAEDETGTMRRGSEKDKAPLGAVSADDLTSENDDGVS